MHEASRWKKWLAGPIIVACATCAAVETSEQMQALDGSGSGSGSSYPDAGTTGGTDGGSGSSGPTCTVEPNAFSLGSNADVGIDIGIGTEKATFKTAAAVFCRALGMAGWPSTSSTIGFKLKGKRSQTSSGTASCEFTDAQEYSGTFGAELCGPFIEGTGAKSWKSTTQRCKECEYAPQYQCTADQGSGCYTNTDKASLDVTIGQNFDFGKFFKKYSSSAVKLSGSAKVSGTLGGSMTTTITGGTNACTGATCQASHSEELSGSLGFDLTGSMSGYVYGFGVSATGTGGGDFTWTVGWNDLLEKWCLLTDVTAKFGISVSGKVKLTSGVSTNTTILKWECKTSLKGDSCVAANNTLEDLVCETKWLVPENDIECQKLSCAALGYKCGSFESCGETMQCGSCNPGYTCEPEWGDSLGTYCREPDDPPPPPPCDEDCHRFCSLECYGDGPACYDGCMVDCKAEACGSGSGSDGY